MSTAMMNRKRQAQDCIRTIREWKNHTEKAMEAVLQLHDGKLWLELGYDSFKDAIEVGCGIGRRWGYELLETAKKRQELSDGSSVHSVHTGSPSLQPLTTEEAAQITPAVRRVLDTIPTAAQVEAVKEASKSGKVTAATVKSAAEKIIEADTTSVQLDCVEPEYQREVPAVIVEPWGRAEAVAEDILHKLRGVKATMKEGIENREQDTIWADSTNTDFAGLSEVIGHVNLHVKPHAVCPICHAAKSMAGCKLCKSRGYIGRHLWQTCVPEETKALLKVWKKGGKK